METTRKPSLLTGAMVGILLTAPLIALFYLGDRILGLPFVPFDVFDALGRILPGAVLTAGIDAMVDTIIALNLGETSTAAKTIEHLIGLAAVMGIGIAVGVALFALFRQGRIRDYLVAGLVAGGIIGVVMALISAAVNLTATFQPEILRYVWIVALFAAWGAGFGWIYSELSEIEGTQTIPEGETSVDVIDRRQFLVRVGGATATLTVIGAGVGALLGSDDDVSTSVALNLPDTQPAEVPSSALPPDLPNADAAVQPAPGTRPEYTPLAEHYRIDISSRPPVIDGVEWVLPITGLVNEPVEMTLDDLVNNYEPVDQYVTMSCISNRIGGTLIGTTRWTGVPLHILLDEWNLRPSASHLKITAADGFDEYMAISLARLDNRVMLAYAWDGQPLTREHGFPLRIYIPNHYGMKQPKWITGIEVVDAWDEGYWVRRGWSESALVKTTSVIDTVAVDDAYDEDGQRLIPIGGIAYSGVRGISRVEVQVDDGEWQEAQLRDPLSELTWVIWRYDWPFQPGNHTFRVRCFEGNGAQQIERVSDVRPDGATGIHSVRRDIPGEV